MAEKNPLSLSFAGWSNPDDSGTSALRLSVRHFAVHERMSDLFDVNVIARSANPNIPIDAIVGKGAALTAETKNTIASSSTRAWAGVCAQMSLMSAQDDGMSQYFVRIRPALWRTTLRKNTRIFQHESTPTIVTNILTMWGITPVNKLQATYKKHDYCVQYAESDYAFICRLLEDAGISFYFSNDATSGSGADVTKLVLSDSPNTNTKRAGKLAYYREDATSYGEQDFCHSVTMSQGVSPGHYTLRDFDFRLNPWGPLGVEGKSGHAGEDVYEQFEYAPGVHRWGPRKNHIKPLADQYGGGEETDLKEGINTVEHLMDGARGRRLTVSFLTNALDLCPGSVVGINQGSPTTADGQPIADHPCDQLSPDQTLLVVQSSIDGTHDGEWTISIGSVFTKYTCRPERVTPRPRIIGVQSAIVVGPANKEIYTDEFGRVRVQFPWDREGKFDDKSSCWLRVSQPWAGGGFGMSTIPRVGHEVLVEFFEGDPDQPVIVGSVHNETTSVPYKLADNLTKSGWKSNSSPGGTGYNELMFEDKAGQELINIQAQKDLSFVVNNNVMGHVGDMRFVKVGVADVVHVGKLHTISVGQTTGTVIMGDQKIIVLSTGNASIKLAGSDIFLNAQGMIHLHAGTGMHLSTASGDINIQGGPNVRVNDIANGPNPSIDTVSAAEPPAAGGPGTPPPLPSGGGAIQEPGGFPDVNVE